VSGITVAVVLISLAAGAEPGDLPWGAIIGVLVLVGFMLLAYRARSRSRSR
jgi:ABC-type Fe3+-siderophore transport system permease subunit